MTIKCCLFVGFFFVVVVVFFHCHTSCCAITGGEVDRHISVCRDVQDGYERSSITLIDIVHNGIKLNHQRCGGGGGGGGGGGI